MKKFATPLKLITHMQHSKAATAAPAAAAAGHVLRYWELVGDTNTATLAGKGAGQGRSGRGWGAMVRWCNQSTRQPATLVSNACVKPPAACCRFASLLQFILIACQAAKRKREREGERARKREKTAAGNSRQHSPGATMRVTRRLQHVKSTVNQVSTRSGQRLCAAALPIEWRQSICSAP